MNCKGTAKTLAVTFRKFNTLRETKTALLTSKRYEKRLRPFYMGVPTPLPNG